ncbi:MAG: endolytic transglycosylase MltG, partial [Candidatus Eisenbacteria bacterium]|nr:endolytic transglycosylase MltG [Candidatus Eisenbacteria bacterium]
VYKRQPRALSRGGIVRVAAGSPLRTVTAALADSGWVRAPALLRAWARFEGLDRRVLPGRYRIPRGASPRQVILRIASGDVERTRVTIPEGWKEKQILDLLADSLEVDSLAVLAVARDTLFLRSSLGLPRARLEGYLFPETYLFPKEYSPRQAIEKIVREGTERFTPEMQARARRIGWTRDSVLILASIVQAEAARSSEMPSIAAVFHNRLRLGWRLDADPTVLYAHERSTGPLRIEDLDIASPYNTYRVTGLPPGPIDNPGEDAIRAVLWPDSTSRMMFFVAKGNGEHHFSRTLAEHERARREIRAARRSE